MKLALRKSDVMDDWYVIERAEHDGATWMEPTEYGSRFCMSSRISDACVEGTATEMLTLANAIERRGAEHHKRCAVDASTEPVRFWSPRNSTTDGECTYAEALELAVEIRAQLGVS